MKRLCIILLIVGTILVASGFVMIFAKLPTIIHSHGVIVFPESVPTSTNTESSTPIPIIAGIVLLIVAGFYNFKK